MHDHSQERCEIDQALEHLHHSHPQPRIVYGLNDRVADGEDISWIWDANI